MVARTKNGRNNNLIVPSGVLPSPSSAEQALLLLLLTHKESNNKQPSFLVFSFKYNNIFRGVSTPRPVTQRLVVSTTKGPCQAFFQISMGLVLLSPLLMLAFRKANIKHNLTLQYVSFSLPLSLLRLQFQGALLSSSGPIRRHKQRLLVCTEVKLCR